MDPATPAGPKPNPDNITVTTPNGHKVVIKGYVSGGANEDLERMIIGESRVEVDPETGKTARKIEAPATAFMDRTRKALELLLVSCDGKTDNLVQMVRDLPQQDYDAIVEKVNEVAAPLAAKSSSS